MDKHVTPMIHVPDVRATANWYESIGFSVDNTYGNGHGGLSFAILSFGYTQVMFNEGGERSNAGRREVDLYIYTTEVDSMFENLKDRVEVIDGPHDTFYGMREFIIRDLNRFWITFGQGTAFGRLMNAVHTSDIEAIRALIDGENLSSDELTHALNEVTSGEHKKDSIAELLIRGGAVEPPTIGDQVLQAHAGGYKSDSGMAVEITLVDGKLTARPEGEGSIALIAFDEVTFKPIYHEKVTVIFKVENGATVGFELHDRDQVTQLKRVS
jgi:hypothetical protein